MKQLRRQHVAHQTWFGGRPWGPRRSRSWSSNACYSIWRTANPFSYNTNPYSGSWYRDWETGAFHFIDISVVPVGGELIRWDHLVLE